MYYYPQRTYTNPPPRRPRRMFFVGIFMTLMGIMVLIGVCIYTLFGLYNTSNLKELNTSIQGPVAMPELPVSQTRVQVALLPDGSLKPIEVIKNVQPVVKDESTIEFVSVTRPAAPDSELTATSEEMANSGQSAKTVIAAVPAPARK